MSLKGNTHKQILISYSRRDANESARKLKQKVKEFGFEVYLDVDEIDGGDDWVDSLNNAILRCEVFVPLITPSYGYTKWTNREIKMADVLNKPIIPINFLKNWPPECLAIQFASTQFIPWKKESDFKNGLKSEEMERTEDIRFWSDISIERVARQIIEHFERKPLTKFERDHIMEKYLFKTKSSLGINKELPSIVISAHPLQNSFVDIISRELTKIMYNVWSTTDTSEEEFNSNINEKKAISHQKCSPSDQHFNKAIGFKNRVDASLFVIVVLSDSYTNSSTSKQQIFYCETRKMIVPIKLGHFESPQWLSKLIDDDHIIDYNENDFHSFIDEFKQRVITKKFNGLKVTNNISNSPEKCFK